MEDFIIFILTMIAAPIGLILGKKTVEGSKVAWVIVLAIAILSVILVQLSWESQQGIG